MKRLFKEQVNIQLTWTFGVYKRAEPELYRESPGRPHWKYSCPNLTSGSSCWWWTRSKSLPKRRASYWDYGENKDGDCPVARSNSTHSQNKQNAIPRAPQSWRTEPAPGQGEGQPGTLSQCGLGVKEMDPDARAIGIKPQLNHLLAMWLWTSYSTVFSLHFFLL